MKGAHEERGEEEEREGRVMEKLSNGHADMPLTGPDEPVSPLTPFFCEHHLIPQSARERSAKSTPPTRSPSTRRERTLLLPRESDDMTVS